jgi:outer membrane protein OmpA-like peptidoglycan-associated protein
MLRVSPYTVVALLLCTGGSLGAQAQDAEGCKDHPLFNRMPNTYIYSCDATQFDLRRFPQGPLKPNAEGENRAATVDVEGPAWKIVYALQEGVTPPSPLQIMRNFRNAGQRAGATIEGEYPGWCEGMLDGSLGVGNGCTHFGVSMRFARGGKDVWAYVQANGDDGSYEMVIAEREAMKQEIVASELLDKINTDGFVALYITFETGKATISPESDALLDQVAAALETAPDLVLEVAGHTDNVGTPASNQTLSEQRAEAVRSALVSRGVAESRLTAKGYGQSAPIADNRTEDGRAKNRRVELVKQ